MDSATELDVLVESEEVETVSDRELVVSVSVVLLKLVVPEVDVSHVLVGPFHLLTGGIQLDPEEILFIVSSYVFDNIFLLFYSSLFCVNSFYCIFILFLLKAILINNSSYAVLDSGLFGIAQRDVLIDSSS